LNAIGERKVASGWMMAARAARSLLATMACHFSNEAATFGVRFVSDIA
jgi:hypothetical protein